MSSVRPFGNKLPSIGESLNPHAFHKRVYREMNPKAATPNPPPPPVIEDTEARQQDEADRLRSRRGRAAAVLTRGNAGVPMTAAKTLLGQ